MSSRAPRSPLRVASDALADPRHDADPARRLLRGIAAAVAEKGYAATTIADIVRHARVSKRTFYEHFPDKQHCYLEAYRRGTDHLARLMVEAGTAASGPWRERLRAALQAYLGVLVERPASTLSFTTGIPAAGSEAIAARRAMHRRTADALSTVVDHVRRDSPELAPLRPLIAEAIVGALSELVLSTVADGRLEDLPSLDEPILDLLAGVLTVGADPTEDPVP
jgi:AcrR family transcriptional regulator